MSKRLFAAYVYLTACMACVAAIIFLVTTDQFQYAAWLLVVAVPLWIGGIVWSIRIRQ